MTATARALTALGEVICRAQTTTRTPMGLAFAVDAAGMLASPETAAELVTLRARNAELEAERHATNEALSAATEQVAEMTQEIATANAVMADAAKAIRDDNALGSDHPAVTT